MTTTTDQPAGLFAPAPGVSADDAISLLDERGFDPTRVRLTGLRPAEWDTEAACAGKATRDADPWHPGGDGIDAPASAAARLTCQACPVRPQCLALALASLPLGDLHGVWAGYTVPELRKIAKDRGIADRTVAQHGTRSRRVAGCDCHECRRAHAEYVARLRAEERYAESDKFEADVAAALPRAEATVTPLPNLLDLLGAAS